MLAKNKRIPRELFGKILESSQYFNSKNFSLRYSKDSKSPRIAISVSKKVSNSAVLRNKIRRRAYSVFSKMFGGLKPGLYLIIAKKGADKVKGLELEKELRSLVVSCLL